MKVRECLENVLPYVPGKTEQEIKEEFNLEKVAKLASNENPYGPSVKVKEILNMETNVYPDNYMNDIREKVCEKLNVDKECVLFGNGSVEIIQMISRVFLDAKDNIITQIPSFSSYFSEAMIQGANVKTIKYNSEYNFNLDEMLPLIDDNTKIIYITNPNNPLGTFIPADVLEEFIQKVPTNILIVVDEAYYEFVRDEAYKSAIQLYKKYSNVCVLRTFSKAYALAALRIGFIVASRDVIKNLEKVRVPFNVSSTAQKCAIAALEDSDYMQETVNNIHDTIDYMYEKLDELNIEYIKTQANFIMVNVGKKSSEVVKKLLELGYIVRDGFPLMDTWIRVSIGTLEQMQDFVKALEEVL